MNERLQNIYNWIVFEAGIQPTPDNHFGTIPNITSKLNLCLQQRPIEISSTIDFFLEKKEQGETLEYYGEIGACAGGTTYAMNNFLNFKELLIVDDNGSSCVDYVTHRKNLERHAILGTIPRVEVIGSSHESRVIERVKQLTESKKLDILLIDGDHSYEGVKQDTLSFLPCVRDGGYILFHDTEWHHGIKTWLEEVSLTLPILNPVVSFKLSGMPHTSAYPDGIGISIFQKMLAPSGEK